MKSGLEADAAGLVDRQRSYFHSGATKPVEFRRERLRQLRALLAANEGRLAEAMRADYGKSAFESFLTEFIVLYQEIDAALKRLPRWAARRRVRTNLLNWPGRSFVQPEPLGVALVIGAWNYPVQLALTPAVAALAAGNTVILKPSELTAATSRVLAELINGNFAPEYFHVREGGVEDTTALLDQRFDKIFFTGSTTVGRVVYRAAARHLTPVTLELGGKSPAIVTPSSDLDTGARRLVWAKFLNAGQTCIAPDYVVVHASVEQAFLAKVKAEIEAAQFSIANDNYVRIINPRHTQRIADLITPENVVAGGTYDLADRIIAPTVLANVGWDDRVMAEEIFGPVLPVLRYADLDGVIAAIRARPKPLALYLFSNDATEQERILRELSFGGGCINDAVMHIGNGHLPFGGVGESGLGSYHGEAGFRAFSHEKAVLKRGLWPDFNFRYSPRTPGKLKLLRWLAGG